MGGVRRGRVEATVSFDVSLHLRRLKIAVVSAFSLVQDYNAFIYERLLSTLVANVARVALSQTYSGWRASFFGPIWDIWNSFLVQQPSELSIEERTLLSVADKFLSYRCCCISVHVPTSS